MTTVYYTYRAIDGTEMIAWSANIVLTRDQIIEGIKERFTGSLTPLVQILPEDFKPARKATWPIPFAEAMVPKPVINLWAQFLAVEKLRTTVIRPKDMLKLMDLCKRLAEIGPPKIRQYKDKQESRRLVVTTAMEMGIDLPAIKKRDGKVAMGRGLLDAWNEQYAKRFGSTFGTSGKAEVTRRTIVAKLSSEKPRHIPNPEK